MVGTDGSGFDSDVPEMMPCGRAVVQLDEAGWPTRARYGYLPGKIKPVGRPERHAALEAVKTIQDLRTAIVDLKGFEEEGDRWDEQLAATKGTRATI